MAGRFGGKRRAVAVVHRLVNPVMRRVGGRVPGEAVIETVGRRSGQRRRTPVGGRLDGRSFWLVSEFGRDSDYVRNMVANPRVRVQLRGRWHAGTAHLLDADDPRARLARLPRMNSLGVRMVGDGDRLLTIRVDLDGEVG
jgi:deazaflavin-dependent oxidoreductase (nitroreductase family)